MSQAAIKPSRPPVVSLTAASIRKSSRPNTPQVNEKTEVAPPATPKTDTIEESPGKSKRRVSNDSAKARSSSRISVDDADKKQGNGSQEQTNGTNGSHSEAKVVVVVETKAAKKETSKKETPKKETPKKEVAKKDVVSEDEMEPLVVIDPVEVPPTETPKASRKVPGTRVLTPRQGPPAATAKPFTKVEEPQSSSHDLSTGSEKIAESPLTKPSNRIMGRRSVRPIKDIQLTYKRANDSMSSLNATVGSTIHNDSIGTPYIMKVGERRRHEEDLSPGGFVDTPSKRARIDFAGYLSYALTPVTFMRNGLSRLGLSSSTPRKLDADMSGQEEDKIADVSSTDVTKAEEAIEDVDLKEKSDVAAEIKDNEEEEKEESRRSEKCCIM